MSLVCGKNENKHLVTHSSPSREPMRVLPILYSWLKRNGVEIVKRKVESISELEIECEMVVNLCMGAGF